MATTQTVRATVRAASREWLDTGLTVGVGENLRATASGFIEWRRKAGTILNPFSGKDGADGEQIWSVAYPEGIYPDNNTHNSAQPNLTAGYAQIPNDRTFPVINTAPYSLALVVLPIGQRPTYPVDDALRPNRDTTFSGQAGRVWTIFNGDIAGANKRRGQFQVTLERQTAASTLPVMRGGRAIPGDLLRHLSGSAQTVAWCWAVKLRNGQWEGYTSLDEDLNCPAYAGALAIPALTYRSGRGVDLSQIPCSLKMGSDGADVTVIGFNRDHLRGGWYDGAEIELFEVNWESDLTQRWVAFSGRMGNATVGELAAKIELVSWEEIARRPIGDVVTYTCRHTFCEGICRNAEAGDGADPATWTRACSVVSSNGRGQIVVQASANLTPWGDRLAGGLLEVTGGDWLGVRRDIKQGVALGAGKFRLDLRVGLPETLDAGTNLNVRSGCLKTPAACQQYDNFINYGGFPFVPLREGLTRVK